MMYGIRTGFETSEFLGLYQSPGWSALTYGSSAYSVSNCSVGEPDYWTDIPIDYGLGSQSPSGGRVMRFQGCTQPNGSAPNFAYMTLASAETAHDPNSTCPRPNCYMMVRTGMHLEWEQYNTQGLMCNVTLDLEFSDGTTLRDSDLTDNYYTPVHPAARVCFSGWRSFDVDLSRLANGSRRITRYMVAFDNPNRDGLWISYFDNVRIEG